MEAEEAVVAEEEAVVAEAVVAEAAEAVLIHQST